MSIIPWSRIVNHLYRCQRCLLGIDDDEDGNCAICCKMDSTTAFKVRCAVVGIPA